MDVWGTVAADFSTRVSSYFELRKELEKGVAGPQVTNNPAKIWGAMRALAERIRNIGAENRSPRFQLPLWQYYPSFHTTSRIVFLGRQLILFDARANLILDRIRHEIPLRGQR